MMTDKRDLLIERVAGVLRNADDFRPDHNYEPMARAAITETLEAMRDFTPCDPWRYPEDFARAHNITLKKE